jgi:hypothetical protein
VISQAEVARAVRGAIKGHQAAGLAVGCVKTEISNGAVSVTITTPGESQQPAGDAIDLEAFKEQLRRRHATGRA